MLSANRLSIGYNPGRPLISDIYFSCAPGELVVLLGVNGIGKSTLLKTLCGLLPPLDGTIMFDLANITDMTAGERAKIVSGVFTGRDFDPFISVREFVSLGRYPYTNWLGTLTADDHRIIGHAMTALGLSHLADKRVTRISDGEKQKTLIAKALAQDTPVIIMDEPTAFLDYKNKAEMLAAIKALTVQQHKIVILSTHDISSSIPYSDKAFLITEAGKFKKIENTDYTENDLKAIMEMS